MTGGGVVDDGIGVGIGVCSDGTGVGTPVEGATPLEYGDFAGGLFVAGWAGYPAVDEPAFVGIERLGAGFVVVPTPLEGIVAAGEAKVEGGTGVIGPPMTMVDGAACDGVLNVGVASVGVP